MSFISHPSLMPSPELSTVELTNQIAALRAELRDGRLLQARQRNELDRKSACVVTLAHKYKGVKREREELKNELNYERSIAAAVEKRLNVAVKNHAEAQDKCARTMVDCEELRMQNEELELLNKELGEFKDEAEADFSHRIKQLQDAFKDKLKAAEAGFMRELEGNGRKLLAEQLNEMRKLQSELDSRDAKIKKLERNLNRQCEINAMFTIDYDRDTNFTKRLSVPLPAPTATTPGRSSGHIPPTQPHHPSPRRSLTNVESNRDAESRKRSRTISEYDEKIGHPPLKSSKLSPLNKIPRSGALVSDDRNPVQKRVGPSYSHNTTNRTQHLPTPDSSFRMKRH